MSRCSVRSIFARGLALGLALGLVSACSTSHDTDPTDAATADAAVVSDGGMPADDAAAIADASIADASIADAPSAEDAPAELDGGPLEGDPRCAPDGSPAPRFRDLFASVIAANGCGNECHVAGSLWSTSLDMSSAEIAYRALVNVDGCGAYLRVTPCLPEESTLSLVPTYREEPCGGRHTFPGGSVTAEQAVMIDDWIRAGAAW